MTIDEIRNEVAIDLSRAVQDIGPMSDELGEFIKDALTSDDISILASLGQMICRSAINEAWPEITAGQLGAMIYLVLRRAERQLGPMPVGVVQQVRDILTLADLNAMKQLHGSLLKAIDRGSWDIYRPAGVPRRRDLRRDADG